jgi:hypothetical protein
MRPSASDPWPRRYKERYGSRQKYERLEQRGEQGVLSPTTDFITARDSCYIATVGSTGWPYIHHPGAPPGFLALRRKQGGMKASVAAPDHGPCGASSIQRLTSRGPRQAPVPVS